MAEKNVQVNVRMTEEQREQIKKSADENKKSMNQYIIDKLLHSSDDRTNDSDDSIDDRTNDSDDSIDDRTESKMLIEALQREVDRTSEQLKNKDEQIKELHSLLDQEQKLHLQTSQQMEKLQLEDPTIQDEKKGFFSRLFNY